MQLLSCFVLVTDFCGPLKCVFAEEMGPQQRLLWYCSAVHELLEQRVCPASERAHPAL